MTLDNPKLLSLAEAETWRRRMRRNRKRVVLTNGVFDVLHSGHIYYLKKAAELGDVLVVALNSDASVRALKGPKRPIESENERAYALGALECVDAIVIFRTPRLTREIRRLEPDVYCKAGDYTLETLDPTERAALDEVGARIKFMPFLPGFSTTSRIAKIRAAG